MLGSRTHREGGGGGKRGPGYDSPVSAFASCMALASHSTPLSSGFVSASGENA